MKVQMAFRLQDGLKVAGWEDMSDFGGVSRGDMLWRFFPGDFSLRVDRVQIETRFGWVPLLHFALSMADICEKLLKSGNVSACYIFTESDDDITFQRIGENVRIEASFEPRSVACPLESLCRATAEFTNQVVSEIGSRYPSFLATPLADEIAAKARELVSRWC